jgi:drug/metabolite transporter (DMT)-like permease
MNQSIKGHGAMLCANVMWGLMSPIAKFVMIGGLITPLLVTNLRIIGAMILFWTASLFMPREHVPAKDLAHLFVASLLAIVFNQGCFIFGVGLTTPGDASIITTSMPLWAMILSAIILKDRITTRKIIGIIAGATGAILLVMGGKSHANISVAPTNAVLGDVLVLIAQLSYALYIVIYKNFVQRYSMFTIMKWMFTFAFICVIPFSYNDLVHTAWTQVSALQAAGLTFIVVCGTFISYTFIVVAQKRLPPTVTATYNYVQPTVACAVAIAWGMDSFSALKGAAIVLIFTGVFLVTRSKN